MENLLLTLNDEHTLCQEGFILIQTSAIIVAFSYSTISMHTYELLLKMSLDCSSLSNTWVALCKKKSA